MSWAMSKAITLLAASAAVACASVSTRADDLASSMEFVGVYSSDFFSNRRGGLERGDRHLSNLDVAVTLNAEQLWDLRGLTLFLSAQSNDGGGLSERFVGDSFGVSGIDAPAASRLYEVGADWTFGAGAEHNLRAGLLDLNSDFDVSDPRGLYVNSVFGLGQELSQTGENGPSTFPTTSLGLRMDLQLAPDWRWLSAAFDGVPGDPNDAEATTVRLNGEDGLLLISELQRWSDGRVQKVAFGVWGYTQATEYLTGSTRNHGWYVSADSRLGALDGARPWRTSLRIGHAQEIVNNHDWTATAALNYDVPRPIGREQSFGIGAAWARTSSALRASEEGIDDYEAVVELTWRAAVTDWLTLQPDLQYIVNPGSQRSIRNAVVVGLHFEIAAPTFKW